MVIAPGGLSKENVDSWKRKKGIKKHLGGQSLLASFADSIGNTGKGRNFSKVKQTIREISFAYFLTTHFFSYVSFYGVHQLWTYYSGIPRGFHTAVLSMVSNCTKLQFDFEVQKFACAFTEIFLKPIKYILPVINHFIRSSKC